MEELEKINKAAVAIIISDGLILGTTRRNSNLWGLVGGKQDPGELMEVTAAREIKEESGIIINANNLYFIFERMEKAEKKGGLDFRTTCYYAGSWSGKINPEKGLTVEWVPFARLLDKKTGAFVEYNQLTFDAFKKHHPKIYKALK